MMKKYNKLMVLVCCFWVFSCATTDEHPYGIYTKENFLTNESNTRLSLLFAHDATQSYDFFRQLYFVTEIGTGTSGLSANFFAGEAPDFKNWTFNPLTPGLRDFFAGEYIAIRRANEVIAIDESIEFDNPAAKLALIGEARFLRALHYFYLVRTFGEVPLYLGGESPEDYSKTPVSSIEDIYSSIIEDLQFAMANVGEFKIMGRADSTAAEALLSKVYLHLASSKEYGSPMYEWVSDANTMYTNAANAARNVMNSSIYALETDTFGNFPDHEKTSSENIYIWAVDLASNTIGRTGLHTLFQPYEWYVPFYTDAPGKPAWIDDPVNGEVVEYEAGWAGIWWHNDKFQTLDANDERRDLYLVNTYDDINGNAHSAINPLVHFPYKYSTDGTAFYTGAAKFNFLRLSDIALTLAEAVGPTAEGYDMMNQIRTRAGIGNLNPALSETDFRDAVWQEREWELAMEYHTLFDLRRTHRVDEYIGMDANYSYFHPLPQREVDLNTEIENDDYKIDLN